MGGFLTVVGLAVMVVAVLRLFGRARWARIASRRVPWLVLAVGFGIGMAGCAPDGGDWFARAGIGAAFSAAAGRPGWLAVGGCRFATPVSAGAANDRRAAAERGALVRQILTRHRASWMGHRLLIRSHVLCPRRCRYSPASPRIMRSRRGRRTRPRPALSGRRCWHDGAAGDQRADRGGPAGAARPGPGLPRRVAAWNSYGYG